MPSIAPIRKLARRGLGMNLSKRCERCRSDHRLRPCKLRLSSILFLKHSNAHPGHPGDTASEHGNTLPSLTSMDDCAWPFQRGGRVATSFEDLPLFALIQGIRCSRVRVSSSPAFFPKELPDMTSELLIHRFLVCSELAT